MANGGVIPKSKMRSNCTPGSVRSRTNSNHSESHNIHLQQTANKPHLPESWAAVLKDIGMPDQLIQLVEKAQFEDWIMQNNHIKGTGLFYSDDFNDLPPRFRKKFLELMYKWMNNLCTKEEVVSKLKGESLVLEPQTAQHGFGTSNSSLPSQPDAQQCSKKTGSKNSVVPHMGHTSGNSTPIEYSSGNDKRDSARKCRIRDAHQQVEADFHHVNDFKNDVSAKTNELHDREMESRHNSQERHTDFSRKTSKQFNYHSNSASRHGSVSLDSENSFNIRPEVYGNKSSKKTSSHSSVNKNYLPCDSPYKKSFKNENFVNNKNKWTSSQSTVNGNENYFKNQQNRYANKNIKATLSQCTLNRSILPSDNYQEDSLKEGHYNNHISSYKTSSPAHSSRKNFMYHSTNSNKRESNFQDTELQSVQSYPKNFRQNNDFKPNTWHSKNSIRSSANCFQKPAGHSVDVSNVRHQNLSTQYDNCAFIQEDKVSVTSSHSELNKKPVSKKPFVNDKGSNNAFKDNRAKDSVKLIGFSQNQADLSKMKNYNGRIVVTVSENVEDLEQWRSYIRSIIKCDDFTLNIDRSESQTLKLIFRDSKISFDAYFSLKNLTKPFEGPYIKNVSSSMSHKYITDMLVKEIDFGSKRYLTQHNDKINAVKKELKVNSSDSKSDKMTIEAIKAKLQSLEDMEHVFCTYIKGIHKKLHDPSQNSVPVKTIDQLKNDFVHECNCLDGCLPIYSKKEEILGTVRSNSVSIIVADTGSGKSTQLAQYLLRDGYAENGIIVCTQPRKMAAVSLCNYISGQLGSPPGEVVGYETGVRKKINQRTKIVFMTDYTLLQKCVHKKEFQRVSCVIVDEAHERSLYSDLLLGMLKKILTEREDLKIIITSATIDPAVFLNYFKINGNAVVEVPGRMYPVSVKWHDYDAYVGWNYVEACAKCAYDIHCQSEEGGILVFLTSPSETLEAVTIFKSYYSKGSKKAGLSPSLLCLHGKQDIDDQLKIFTPASKGHRKIVFATNSAETSVTIPDIKYVVDSGMAKELRYDEVKKRSTLAVGFVSRSSATQRKGRAGRTQKGICYRMYTEKNFQHDMVEDSLPEILRSPLQKALLKIMDLRIQPKRFDFLSAPPLSSITDAMNSLYILGAVEGEHLTELGKKMAKISLEPQLAKLILKGVEKDIGYEVVIIVASIIVSRHIFSRTDENKAKSDEKKLAFCHPNGDFYTYLSVFHEWTHTEEDKRAKWCNDNFINVKAMKTTTDFVNELCQTLWAELQISVSQNFKQPAFFHEMFESILFECFSENVCIFSGHERAGYISPFHGDSFFIHPSSALSYLGEKPQFVIYDITLYTSRNFLLHVAPVTENAIMQAYQEGKFSIPVHLLKNLQVHPKVCRPIGETILIRHVLGKDGLKIKEIEKKIQCLTKSAAFHISVSVEKGEVVIFAEQQHHKVVSSTIEKFIEDGCATMVAEEEVMNAPGSVYYNFVLGCGGNVHDIILPGESREVIIKSRTLNVHKVLQMSARYGTLASHYEFQSDFPSLSVTYTKVSSADKAVLAFQRDKAYTVTRGKVNIFQKEKSEQLFRILVKWCRLPCKGSGFIEFFSPQDCIEASYKLTVNSIYVGVNYVVVESHTKRGDRVLKMTNLPSDAEEHDVKLALKEHLPNHILIKSIKLVRDDQIKTFDNEMSMQKRRLQEIFAPYSSANNFQVELQHPEPSDTTWTAIIHFSNMKDGEKALSTLKGNLKLGNFKADLSLILKSTLHCRVNIYNVLQTEIRACRKKAEASDSNISVLQKGNYVSIQISCKSVKTLREMHREIITLIQGRRVVCSEHPILSKLFAQRSRVSFDAIQTATKTLIMLNKVAKTILIYGSKKSCEEAEHLITHKSVGSGILKTKIFDLHGTHMPTGFVKILYQKYGFDLDGLVKLCSLKSAYIDPGKHQLILEGLVKHITEAEDHLEELCSEISESIDGESQQKVEPNEEFCPVCLDKISATDAIRLENCGHPVCKQCLQLQLKSEVFPVICVKKDCDKPFVIEDFRRIFATQEELKKKFSEAALLYFIKQNSSEVRYCPTPDCHMIYRVGTTEFQKVCPSCENSICTRCHSLFHHGMSCEMFQKTRRDEDYPLKVWLRDDALNRKACPVCFMAIEKDGGCNHMTCSNCNSHICWLCMQVFKSSDEVYNHIPLCCSSA